jgi:uncharacterized membrane protein SpoIIM required for sporulation
MKEAAFIKINNKKWKEFEELLSNKRNIKPDKLGELYILVTDDLAFAQSHFPGSDVLAYLNGLAANLHQKIYKTQREESGRLARFWAKELPEVMSKSFRPLLYSFLIFVLSAAIGALSAANDDTFVRLILGDEYVNMTIANIEKGDPMAVYKQMGRTNMFLGITLNNIWVSFIVFAFGILTSLGTGFFLFRNGLMLGAFQYFFFEKGLFVTSFLTIWIHGTLEIAAIIIAGAAGITMGNGILFPGTLPRMLSFQRAAKKGLKIVVGTIPIFIIAAFLEGFVTRLTDISGYLKIMIIGLSFIFILYYFIFLPLKIKRNAEPKNTAI